MNIYFALSQSATWTPRTFHIYICYHLLTAVPVSLPHAFRKYVYAGTSCINCCTKLCKPLTMAFVSPCSAAVHAQHMELRAGASKLGPSWSMLGLKLRFLASRELSWAPWTDFELHHEHIIDQRRRKTTPRRPPKASESLQWPQTNHAKTHFRLQINSTETVNLWNWFSTLPTSFLHLAKRI